MPHLQPDFSMTISSAVFGVSCCEWLDENLAEFFDVTVLTFNGNCRSPCMHAVLWGSYVE